MKNVKIIDTHAGNIREFGVCGYKSIKRAGYPEKLDWLENRFAEGLRIKTLVSENDGPQGMIEYLPGELCWRPVQAKGYMFIHCLFVGFKKQYKGHGLATRLLEECVQDARAAGKHGVAVVTRKGSFMVDNGLFLKYGFKVMDTAEPDFELLCFDFKPNAPGVAFFTDWGERKKQYGTGLVIIRADQCPYTVKNVSEIVSTAHKQFSIEPRIVTLKDHTEAQKSPCPFGVFCLLYNGEILAHHPISQGRFLNIMKKFK
ncbi:GNAT family N-acetyltransferase [candidate division KSB1 bacterium]|nr:GNAT family N-acetyltransferase [candidate division KSB1 bacterium]